MKTYDVDSDKKYILEVDVKYPKNFINVHGDLGDFQLKERKFKKCNKLVCNINDNENCCSHNSFKASIKFWINTLKSTQSSLTNQKALLKHGSNRLVTKNGISNNR